MRHVTLKVITSSRSNQKLIRRIYRRPTIVDGFNSVRMPGDPTEQIATRLMTIKQLKYLTEVAKAIEELYMKLSIKNSSDIDIGTINNLHVTGIALELNVSKRQAMRWRDEIILATIELLRWG